MAAEGTPAAGGGHRAVGFGLVIGNTYADAQRRKTCFFLDPLTGCEEAATRLTGHLRSDDMFPAFAPGNVRSLLNASAAEMLDAFNALVQMVDDHVEAHQGVRVVYVLLSFSGHGATCDDSGGDSRAQLMFGNDGKVAPVSELMRALDDWAAGYERIKLHFAALFDCCRTPQVSMVHQFRCACPRCTSADSEGEWLHIAACGGTGLLE